MSNALPLVSKTDTKQVADKIVRESAGEFSPEIFSDVFEYTMVPALRALMAQWYPDYPVSEVDRLARNFLKSAGGLKMKACLAEFMAQVHLSESAKIWDQLKVK